MEAELPVSGSRIPRRKVTIIGVVGTVVWQATESMHTNGSLLKAYFFEILFSFILYIWMFCLLEYLCNIYMQCPWKSGEGMGPHETQVTGGEPSHRSWELNLCLCKRPQYSWNLNHLSSPKLLILKKREISFGRGPGPWNMMNFDFDVLWWSQAQREVSMSLCKVMTT